MTKEAKRLHNAIADKDVVTLVVGHGLEVGDNFVKELQKLKGKPLHFEDNVIGKVLAVKIGDIEKGRFEVTVKLVHDDAHDNEKCRTCTVLFANRSAGWSIK